MSKSRVLVGVALLVLVAAVATILLKQKQERPVSGAVKMGAILPLTGEAASYGEDCRRGIELALDDARTKYSLPINIIFEDSKADPKAAVSAFNKLVNVDKVNGIVGDMFSSTTLAIAPLAQQSGVILLSPTAADESIAATGDMVFSIYPPASAEGRFMADHLEPKALKRVVVLYQNQTATKAIADAFASKVKARGGVVVLTESIAEEKSTYRSLMEKVAAANPTCLYISAYRDPVALLVTTGKEMKLPVLYATQSTLYDEKALADYPGRLDGVLISGPFFDATSTAPAAARFSADYRRKYSRQPSVWSAYGYDAAEMLVDAFVEAARSGGKANEKLTNSVYQGLTGRTVIRPDRSIDKEMVLYTVDQNRFVRR